MSVDGKLEKLEKGELQLEVTNPLGASPPLRSLTVTGIFVGYWKEDYAPAFQNPKIIFPNLLQFFLLSTWSEPLLAVQAGQEDIMEVMEAMRVRSSALLLFFPACILLILPCIGVTSSSAFKPTGNTEGALGISIWTVVLGFFIALANCIFLFVADEKNFMTKYAPSKERVMCFSCMVMYPAYLMTFSLPVLGYALIDMALAQTPNLMAVPHPWVVFSAFFGYFYFAKAGAMLA